MLPKGKLIEKKQRRKISKILEIKLKNCHE